MSEMSDTVLRETASDYAAYVAVDMNAELKSVHDAVEEMQLRLEEFSSILGMMQARGDKAVQENIPRFLSLRPQVNTLCKRIDALDFFVTRANLDLATLEANMESAEAALGSENRFALLNPFSFFKKTPESTTNTQQSQATNQPPQIFKMDDYFKTDS